MFARLKLLVVAAWCALAPRAEASPLAIGYGGRLSDAGGAPVAGPVDLSVQFFGAVTGGSGLLAQPLEFPGTALASGVFQLQLALTPAQVEAVFGDGTAPVFVGVTDVTHHKAYPRQKFLAVPLALRVPVDGTSVVYDGSGKLSVGAVDAAKVTGLTTMLAGMGDAAKLQGVPLDTGTPAAGEVLKFVGGKWQAVPDTGVNRNGDTMAGFLGIGTTSAQTALDVAGVLTQRAGGAPGVAPAGEGRIYFDSSSNQFMVSQNGGAYAPLGTVTGGVITQVSAGTGLTGGGTTGNVTVGLAAVGTAGTYTKVWTDANGRVTAGGTLTAADLPTIPVGLISGALPVGQLAGTLAAAQVAAIPATQIQGGTLATALIPQLAATQINSGTLATAQLPALSAAEVTSGTLAVALGGTGVTSFPAGGVVVGAGSLPLSTVSTTSQYQLLQQGASGPVFGAVELGQASAVSGTLAVAHLPAIPAAMVTGSLAAAQISGTLAAAQVGPIPVSQISGTLASAQVGSIPVAQISGTFTAAQLPSIPASSITGSLGAAQISGTLAVAQLPGVPATLVTGSLAAAQISGTLAAAQVGPIPVTQLTGTLAAAQVGAIPVTQLTGTLAAAQVGAIPVTQLTGTLAATQVGAVPVTQLTGTLTAAQLPSIPVGQLSGTLATTQLPAIPVGQLSGTIAAAQVPPVGQLSGTLAVSQEAAPGAAGQVLFNGGATPSADANLLWDNTNKRLGVGATPGYPLDVTANNTSVHFGPAADSGGFLISTSATQGLLSGGAAYNGTNWVAKATSASIVGPQGGAVTLSADTGLTVGNTFTPTERLRVTTTGISIGNTNTPYPLLVSGTDTTHDLAAWSNRALGADVGDALGLGGHYTAGASTSFAILSGLKNNATSGDYGGYFKIDTRVNGGGFAERLRITDAGNVGIGTSSPQKALHVVSGGQPLRIERTGMNALDMGFVAGLVGTDSYDAYFQPVNTTPMGYLFNTHNGTVGVNALAIDNTGKVGIGTLCPGYTLDVNGAAALGTGSGATSLDLRDAAGSRWRLTTGNSRLGFKSDQSGSYVDQMVITNTGYVGIGTLTPSVPLHVQYSLNGNVGPLYLRNSSTGSLAYTEMTFGNDAAANAMVLGITNSNTPGIGGPNSVYLWNRMNAPIFFGTGGVGEAMRIAANGNVGIGTTSASVALQVNGEFIRTIQHAGAAGPNDTTDNGALATRVLTFVKRSPTSTVRVYWHDNFRVQSTSAASSCEWELKFNAASCPSGSIHSDYYEVSANENHHQPGDVVGYCTGLAAGTYTLQGYVASPVSGQSVASDCFTGWNNSYWVIEAEEIN